jgi:sulfofructose kinase
VSSSTSHRPGVHVVAVGLAVSDRVFDVDALPTTAGKHFARGLRHVGGGPAANGAVTVARLGGRAGFVGCVGDDADGRRIVADLRAEGVATDHVRVVAGVGSPTSAVMVDPAGERMIVNFLDPALQSGAAIDATPFADADAVLADMRWPVGALAGLTAAAARGVPGVLDYDSAPPQDDLPVLTAATHVAFAAPALAARTRTHDPIEGLRRAAELTDAWSCVTLGSDGVRWIEDGEPRHLAAFEVTAVDTLGAGDVFHGALALELGRGLPEPDAVRLASAAAALKCTRPGGRDGIPHAADLAAFLTARATTHPTTHATTHATNRGR